MKYILLALLFLAGCAPTPPPQVIEKRIAIVKIPDAILMYFGAEWCQPCKKMKKVTLEDKEVRKALRGVKISYFDVDDLRDKATAEKYGVTHVPTYILASKRGPAVVVLQTGVGYRTPEEFLIWLKR